MSDHYGWLAGCDAPLQISELILTKKLPLLAILNSLQAHAGDELSRPNFTQNAIL